MKTITVALLIFLAIFTISCHCQEEVSDPEIKNLQTEEDAVPAESQDIVYRTQPLPDGTTISDEDRPRRRYRGGGKRRRRQRKRLRTTTPSFIEEYTSHPITDQEDVPQEREEVVYERRRTGKRRRRPQRRPQPFETNRHDSPDEGEQYPVPARSVPRRRRKGQRRKRIRKPHINHEDGNYTGEDYKTNLEQTTPQTEQDITMNTFAPDETLTQSEQDKVEDIKEPMATIMPSSVFTPSEISEINYKLEPVSRQTFNDQEYTLAEQPSNTKTNIDETIQYTTIPIQFNAEENHSINIQTTSLNDSEEVTTTAVTTTSKFPEEQQPVEPFRNEILKLQPKPDVFSNNIESIIKSRKSLFSISRRLPPTSAVIRRRLRPRLQKNSTNIETNSKIKSPTHLNTDKKVCKDGQCLKEVLPMSVIQSKLLPAGFTILPEILSPKQLLNKFQPNVDLKSVTPEIPTETLPVETSSTTTITSTTMTSIPTSESTSTTKLSTTISTTSTTTTTETSTMSSTTTESTTHKETPTTIAENLIEETTKTDSLKFGDVVIPNLNDGILDLLKTESGQSRLNRILELRNMTLRELLDHRERGSSQRHLSDIFINNKETNTSKINEYQITNRTDREYGIDTDQKFNHSDIINLINDSLEDSDKNILNSDIELDLKPNLDDSITLPSKANLNVETDTADKVIKHEKSKSLKSFFEDNIKPIKIEGTVIPVPILEPTHISMIQFPDDSILGAFPKFITDTLKSNGKQQYPILISESKEHHDTINKPKINIPDNDKKELRIFDSMPKFSSGLKTPEQHNLRFNPDWRMLINKGSTESNFPRIGDELFFHTSSPSSTTDDIVDDVVLLDENDDGLRRNHILGGKISAESGETLDEDYSDYKKLPTGVKSAIFASIAIFGIAIFGFLSVLVSCRVRQRKVRLRNRNDILCEHLHEDLRSSQRSLTPVLKKVQGNNSGHHFGQGIHSNTSSNRHYYLWRTLRKTFQYE